MLGQLRSILLASCALAVAGCSIEHRRDEDAGAHEDAALDAREPALDAPPDAPSRLDAPCPPGFVSCDGSCVSPREDPMHCGADLACEGYAVCVGNEVCVEGVCSLVCDPGLTNCDGYCVSTRTDPMHCGASPEDCTGGESCAPDFLCRDGACMPDCTVDEIACDGECVDPRSDEAYCGASAACEGGVVCRAREACTAGTCACVAPERDCGAGCVDTRFDPANCGMCGNACGADEICARGTCASSTGPGLTGVFDTAWTASDFREVECIQELLPRFATDLHVGGGATFAAYDTLTATLRPETAPPFPFPRGCSFASYGGGIFLLTSTNLMFFQPPTHEWRTAPLGVDLGALGMTIGDGTSLWSATTSGFLVRASAASSTVDTIAVGAPMIEPRLTYDALVDRIFFASRGSSELRSYDPVTRSVRLESTAPGPIGAAFCGDRTGHVYVGSEAAPRQLWQYTLASGTWASLPLLSGSPLGTTNCGVDEAGALYVAEVPGTRLHRLALERR